jgi:L-ribulokinase
MFGAVAAGSELGGFDSIEDASSQMARLGDERYVPNPANKTAYDELYAEYVRLHDLFGRRGTDAMKHLRAVQRAVIESDAVG